MTTIVDVEIDKMKVNDLKRELKSRGLATAGNKAELVQRLSEFISSEEKTILQEDSSVGDESSNNIDVSEEAVLGILPSANAAESGEASEKDSAADDDSTAEKTAKVPSTGRLSGGKHNLIEAPPVVQTTGKIRLKSPEGVPVPAEDIPESDHASTEPEKDKVKSLQNLTEAERRLERTKKFKSDLSMEDRRVLRAQRFGFSNGTTTAKGATSEQVLSKRAQRFGLPSAKVEAPLSKQDLDSKLKKRADRFGATNKTGLAAITTGKVAVSVDDAKARLLKRKERFGPIDGPSVKKTDANEAQKLKRAERFSLRQ